MDWFALAHEPAAPHRLIGKPDKHPAYISVRFRVEMNSTTTSKGGGVTRTAYQASLFQFAMFQ